MPYPLPLTRTEAYLAYKAGVIQQADLKPSLAVPRNGIDAWLAYWTGLADDYPKREDGTPHILQEEEAYIAYLCGVINEYPEKCLRRVGAYLRYLISARWGRPDHPLNREELYLSLIKTQVIPSGDPSSNIVIDGTAKAAFVDAKMYGDTSQKTYTGSNLYMAKPYSNATQQGIKTTIKDGYIFECSGTATTTYSNIADWTNVSLPAGTYTFCIDHTLTHNITMRLSFDPDTQDVVIAPGNTSTTVTVSSPIVAMRPFIATGGSGNVIGETIKLNLVAGSTPATVFEPYVGGIPAPSPEFPVAVQTVTGLQTVEVKGKNKLDANAEPYATILADYEVNGDEIAVTYNPSGGGTGNYAYVMFRLYVGKDIEAGQTYTLSYDSVRRNIGTPSGRILFTTYSSNSESPTTNLAGANYPGKSVTFTVPNDAIVVGVALYCPKSNGVTQTYSKVMVEKGSSASSYVPFSANRYEINLGKNLYVPTFTTPNVTLTEDGFEITTSQTNSNPTWSSFATLELKLNPWTEYTLSKKSSVVEGNEYNHSGGLRTYIEGVYGSEKDEDTLTFTTGASGVVVLLFYTGYLDTTQGEIYTKVRFEKVQIEAGPDATSYAPYFTPIELCKLGTYQDYIWKDGEDWKVHKATGKYVFTGSSSENWFKSGATTSTMFVGAINVQPLGIYIVTSGPANYSVCDHFVYDVDNVQAVGEFRFYNASSGYIANLRFCVTGTSETSVDDFKDWVASNKPVVYYALAAATDTAITDQALIAQLEALVNGGAEEGTTYIKVSATDPNLPGLLYVEAPKYE